MKRKTKTPQIDFPNFTGIYFNECKFIIVKDPIKYEFRCNLLLIFENEFEKLSLQLTTFPN